MNENAFFAFEQFMKAANIDKNPDGKEYLTIKEACKITKFSRWTIFRMLRMTDTDGNYLIRWSKHGTAKNSPVRIDKASFFAFLESYIQYAKKEGVESK